ncbi:RNA polymerase sigma factor [Ilumatobacter coccineus]|uniref:Putative RNA polymerase ECF subfamily sigma factor n=1 Tax=Ilumatobacter coccineus (strain NBRC 103263 / KCTC 29153 / YM16-304) TaxID=1313172 RepID=A0A6C7E3L9_ILUCY|nr:RNA polymerase sigma factor [Ilumatobacter coccineus]BAN01300.1 putative RNA polymerase ECF subfamily sigma factor [Ilumatobacter coccineus YM16-304]
MSFEEQFAELAPLAYRTAFRIVGVRSEAEEIAQDTMAKALQRWSKISGHARPWVCRVAANDAIGAVRKRNRRRSIDRQTFTPDPTDGGAAAVQRLDLQRVLLDLPKRQREVVALRYVADLTEADVAAELKLSLGTVKTHARRALEALRTALGDDESSATTHTTSPTDSTAHTEATTDARTT